jgi:Fe-Mn family superoxide dismutase
MPLNLPRLPYELDALEPLIGARTLKLHHGSHHRGYVKRLNALVKGTGLERLPLEAIVRQSARGAAAGASPAALFDNAAQAWNHEFQWLSLRPARHRAAPGRTLAQRIARDFGGHAGFLEAFRAAAAGHFGSGWLWLIAAEGRLRVVTTANADTPLVHGHVPLLTLDLWEHAYYLDYHSRRDAYVSGVAERLLDWDFAERNFLQCEAPPRRAA